MKQPQFDPRGAISGSALTEMDMLRAMIEADKAQREATRTAVEQEIAAWHRREAERIRQSWDHNKQAYVNAGGEAVLTVASAVKWHEQSATAISSGAYRKPAQGDAGGGMPSGGQSL